jgi:nucleotide-binding universal stress UspA family protein
MKNLLVPTDFSDCAQNASYLAMQLAIRSGARIHFLHIMPAIDGPHVPMASKPTVINPKKGWAQNELNKLVMEAMRMGIDAKPILAFDKAGERIENYISPLMIDLIVMGSHGATGIREFVIGSNTQRVVRNATVPVLVIKKPVSDSFVVKNILFASTFEENLPSVFNLVASFTKLWDATLHILFINFRDKVTTQPSMDGIVKGLLAPYPDIKFTTNSIETNDEEWGIHEMVERIGADMIALTTHDKEGFLISHSVAENLVNHEEVPVLVIGSNPP